MVVLLVACGDDEKLPVRNPASAAALLERAESFIYSPLDEGLDSLSFHQSLLFPGLKTGTITYDFRAPRSVAFQIDLDPAIPDREDQKASILENQWRYLWRFLGLQLGRPLTCMGDRLEAAFVDGPASRQIVLTPDPDSDLAPRLVKILCCFEPEEDLLKSMEAFFEKGDSMMLEFVYKPYKTTDLRLIDFVERWLKTPFGDQKSKEIYRYQEIEGFHLVTSLMTQTQVMGRVHESESIFSRFKINQ